MDVIFYTAGTTPEREAVRGWPRATSLCLSGFLHGAVVGTLLFWVPTSVRDRSKSLYTQVIAPSEKKIVWYPLRKPPVVDPTQRIGAAAVAQGLEKRNDVMISSDPLAKPGKQLLWRPDTKVQVDKEIPSPTLIALEEKHEVAKPLKPFTPPAPASPAEIKPAQLPSPPAIRTGVVQGSPLSSQLTAPKPKNFVPPAIPPVPRPTTEQLVIPAYSKDLPAGTVTPSQGVPDSLLRATQAHRPFLAPPTSKGSGGSSQVSLQDPDPTVSGGGDVKGAVLSSAPIDKFIIPEGSHSAQMSGAPTMGPTASGTGGGDGLKMAGVAVRPGLPLVGGPKLPVPSTLPSARPVVYEETRIAASRTSLSAPLRPAARIIPRLIEARFTGRVVYTMIISKPKMPMYMEDWILWFAEKDPMPGNAPLVRSPLPVRKVEPVSDELKVPPTGRVQLAATILKDGHVDSPRVFDGAKSEASQAAIRDLQSWQFLPALRAGDPVEVEIVIEVVFQNGGTEVKH